MGSFLPGKTTGPPLCILTSSSLVRHSFPRGNSNLTSELGPTNIVVSHGSTHTIEATAQAKQIAQPVDNPVRPDVDMEQGDGEPSTSAVDAQPPPIPKGHRGSDDIEMGDPANNEIAVPILAEAQHAFTAIPVIESELPAQDQTGDHDLPHDHFLASLIDLDAIVESNPPSPVMPIHYPPNSPTLTSAELKRFFSGELSLPISVDLTPMEQEPEQEAQPDQDNQPQQLPHGVEDPGTNEMDISSDDERSNQLSADPIRRPPRLDVTHSESGEEEVDSPGKQDHRTEPSHAPSSPLSNLSSSSRPATPQDPRAPLRPATPPLHPSQHEKTFWVDVPSRHSKTQRVPHKPLSAKMVAHRSSGDDEGSDDQGSEDEELPVNVRGRKSSRSKPIEQPKDIPHAKPSNAKKTRTANNEDSREKANLSGSLTTEASLGPSFVSTPPIPVSYPFSVPIISFDIAADGRHHHYDRNLPS